MSAAAPDIAAARTRWAWWTATFLGSGFLRPGPGTWASAETAVLWYLAASRLPANIQAIVAVAVVAAACAIGIPAATVVERECGRHDPAFVVIDEVAGQMLALLAVPLRWKTVLISFILFRVFDVIKPPPVRSLERFPGGAGIVLDDLGAGLYALICVQVLLHLGVI